MKVDWSKVYWLVLGFLFVASPAALGQTRTYPMTMTWTDNSNNEDGFILYLRATGQTTYTEVGRTAANTNTFVYTATGIEGTAFCFAVSAYNVAGESTKSAEGCGAIPVTVPVALTNLTGSITTAKLVTLNWLDASDNEQGFKVYRNGVEVATLPASPGLGAAKTYTETVTGAAGTVYTYEVAPFNSAGMAAKSNTVTLTVVGQPIPVAPTGLGVVVGQRTAALKWNDLPSEIGYQVMRNGYIVGETDANLATFQDTGLTPNRWYIWSVRALYPGGIASTFSATVMKKTLK